MAPDDTAASSTGRFCILAWNHLQIAPNGTVKMCCVASEDIHDNGRPFNIYIDSYESIWNSDYMREARRGLVAGEDVSACRRCFDEEKLVGQSRRTIQTTYHLDTVYGCDAEDFIAEARRNDWRVEDRPHFLQLNMGNQCNLACRMCSSQYSSRIEADPVHSKWMPSHVTDVARWQGDRLPIGPRPVVGVEVEGCHRYQVGANVSHRWTSGTGRFSLDIPHGSHLTRLGLELAVAPGNAGTVRIQVNGLTAYTETLSPQKRLIVVPLDGLGNQSRLEFSVSSGTVEHDGRTLGVAIHAAWLERDPARSSDRSNSRTLTRFATTAGWWGQPEFMFDEMLAQPDKIKRLIFQGGEPMMVKEFEGILDHLIEAGVTQGIILEIVSNLTLLKDSVLDKLSQFAAVELGCSIDGIGPDLEYIRWPAQWQTITDNIARALRVPSIRVQFNVAVQAYNLMRITDLMRYCDARAIMVHTHFLVGPAYLSILVLPPALRRVALTRIEAYLNGPDVTPHNRASAEYMATFLRQQDDVHHRHLFEQFMLFTNDMDTSRDQDFVAAHPEVLQALADDGLVWTAQTRHNP